MNTTRQMIVDAQDRGRIVEKVPEWNCTVVLIEPSIGEVLGLQEAYLGEEEADVTATNLTNFNWAMFALVAHDQDGVPLFTSMEDAKDVLGKKASKVVARLIERCGTLIQLPDEKVMEEARKNSETTPD